MPRLRAETGGRRDWRSQIGSASSALVFVLCVVAIVLSPPDRVDALTVVLGLAAIGAGVLVVGEGERGAPSVSASFLVYGLAAAFLGITSAAAAAVISELFATAMMRTRLRSVVFINLPTNVGSAVLAALIIRAVAAKPADAAGFYVAVAVAVLAAYIVGFGLYSTLRRLNNRTAEQVGLRAVIDVFPSAGLSVLLVVAGISITFKVGTGAIAFALAAVFAFSYMMYLLEQSRRRAQSYVSLSWGVLAGLMRSLDIRDGRAARHAAAVARFAQDIAGAIGMSDEECELAHTAGLLHDIGHFALSDRVAERGRTLTEEDWMAIHRHPELGADMLRDLGMYGPVAEIVIAHHERIDGRGYPKGLGAQEIPEIAKIISVAEVYDTLTASDTYRTRMSSFEALTELRRVAGSQVDARYVEVLAGLLTGVGVEYRHADMANFDAELNMERRIKEAGAGG